ncbi:hypothetical protein F442_20144 [Phytophthora nicotianae P10297]|uniref:Uncharacterized protein n=1 Tax=Phytophthora nicotianae P10297 TaxID=1317064 RepID=W2Y890_PHYNI|nr:hypothetical protein F442_20144 [Phytophthora nicotianae P10297]
MSRTTPWSASRGPQHIRLSTCGFAFWWFAIFTVHLVTCVYNIVYAKLYWGLEITMFSFYLAINGIGMSYQDFHSIAYVYMVLAAIHGMCALLMIVASLWHRKLVFMPKRRKAITKSAKTNRKNFNVVDNTSNSPTIQPPHPDRVIRFFSAMYHRLGSHHGILGVKGEHFHVVLICRELVELSLQTAQAIRMSKYLPRILLNRFYVSLLVINCWSSVFAYSRWFWRDEACRRFAAIVCDCVLNLMTTLGVSLIIMLSYINEFDIHNFDWRLLEDDAWVSQMLNEARIVLVMSWSDLATRAFFSLSLVATTGDMKELLKSSSKRQNRGTNAVGPSESLANILTGPNRELVDHRNNSNVRLVVRQSSYKSTGLRTRLARILLQGVHYAFGAWGIVVLILHVHASMQTPLFECTPKVYPMAGALPSCYTVTFDCYCMGITGLKSDVKREWEGFDRITAVKLRILHCQSLEVPQSFQDFSGLEDVVVYNSTILEWGDTAALTNTNHPKMKQITILRVNMTGGSLPLGLQSLDFPKYLGQINFSETNLATLPDDLDAKWPPNSVVQLENSQLVAVPSGLVRLQPYYLALTGNPITSVPPELFEGNVQYIFLGRTQLGELPENVTPISLTTLEITYTNISYFPSWIDPLVEVALDTFFYPLIVGGGSTYCSEVGKIMSGVTTNFNLSFRSDYSSLLMNASEPNWELLNLAVDCSPPLWKTQFSTDYFDATYGLET